MQGTGAGLGGRRKLLAGGRKLLAPGDFLDLTPSGTGFVSIQVTNTIAASRPICNMLGARASSQSLAESLAMRSDALPFNHVHSSEIGLKGHLFRQATSLDGLEFQFEGTNPDGSERGWFYVTGGAFGTLISGRIAQAALPAPQPTRVPMAAPTAANGSEQSVQPAAVPAGQPQPTAAPAAASAGANARVAQVAELAPTTPPASPTAAPTPRHYNRATAQPAAAASSADGLAEPAVVTAPPTAAPAGPPAGDAPTAPPRAASAASPTRQPTAAEPAAPTAMPVAPTGQPTGAAAAAAPTDAPTSRPSANMIAQLTAAPAAAADRAAPTATPVPDGGGGAFVWPPPSFGVDPPPPLGPPPAVFGAPPEAPLPPLSEAPETLIPPAAAEAALPGRRLLQAGLSYNITGYAAGDDPTQDQLVATVYDGTGAVLWQLSGAHREELWCSAGLSFCFLPFVPAWRMTAPENGDQHISPACTV